MAFYNERLETLSKSELYEHQSERLRRVLAELKDNAFYQDKFLYSGIQPDRVSDFTDLAGLQFTTKAEIAADQEKCPPYGRLLSYPITRYSHFNQTSGTTGRSLRWIDTEQSWDWFTSCWGYVYSGAGIGAGDIVFCAFSFGPYISHWTAISGAWRTGALCIPGGGMNSDQRLRAIIDNRCTAIVCTPTYALHLAEVAALNGMSLRDSAVRVGIHAGEPGASLPNVKKKIEESWGMTVYDHAGATEVGAWSYECEAQCGAMHLNEAEFIIEVIDPETGLSTPEGGRGELVITNLGRPAMPVLRYRTGDLIELTREPCSCGRTFARIKGGVLGRADDMFTVRGVNLYPAPIDNLIRSVAGVVEYEVNIRRVLEMDDLLVRIETDGKFDDVKTALLTAFRREFNIRVSIDAAERGALPRYEFKARRFKRV